MKNSACYLALLRGINVGGRNIIKMTDLKASFEEIGCADVSTFIQSGNVLFRPGKTAPALISETIERALSARFAYTSRVVVVSQITLAKIVQKAPPGFGTAPDQYKYDVIFLRDPLTPRKALQGLTPKQGVDTVHQANGVLYFSRLTSKLTQSRLSKIVTLPTYQNMTIRNWNTTTKLLALMETPA